MFSWIDKFLASFKKETETEPLFLSKIEYLILIDGYCRKQTYRESYIAIDLCRLIMEYFIDNLYFYIISEKGLLGGEINELLCFNFENNTKTIIENRCWKHARGTNYCIGNKIGNNNNNNNNMNNNEYNYIYRIEGESNLDNICYNIKNNNIIKLPNSLKKRLFPSSIYCEKYGLFVSGSFNDNSVEILTHKNEWKYLNSMNNKRMNHDSILIDDKIFVCGGYDGANY